MIAIKRVLQPSEARSPQSDGPATPVGLLPRVPICDCAIKTAFLAQVPVEEEAKQVPESDSNERPLLETIGAVFWI